MAHRAHKQDEFLEAAFDFGQWIERHWKTVLRYLAFVLAGVILIAAVFGWQQHRTNKASAELELGAAAFTRAATSQFIDFEALADALTRFEKAEDIVGNRNPGPLATYYRGVTLYRLGRNDDAIAALESFIARSDGDQPLDWAGLALLTRLKIDSGDAAGALTLLEGAAGADSAYPLDQVLLLLGEAQQAVGNADAARAAWQRVVDEFSGTMVQVQARDHLTN